MNSIKLLVVLYIANALFSSTFAAKPGEEYDMITDDGAWCWFADPRAVYYEGDHQKTYIGWVDESGDIILYSYDSKTHEMQTANLHTKLHKDDHANPSITILPDGRIRVFYSHHFDKIHRSRVTVLPEDISVWEPETEIDLNKTTEYPASFKRGVCYSNPRILSEENNRLYIHWRGIGFKPNLAYSDDMGQTFSPAKILIQPKSNNDNGQRPYIKVGYNTKDTIPFVFTDGHPRNEPLNSVYYVAYRDGAFYTVDNKKICDYNKLPLSPESATKIYNATSETGRAWVWDITQDANGYPVIVYTRHPKETDHRYHYVRWSGSKWIDTELCKAGKWFPETPDGAIEPEPHYSGGITIDHSNPNIVYLSRAINGTFEIEKWQTKDDGEHWLSSPVTKNSKNDNVRPFVVLNSTKDKGIHLVWMNNEKYIHYTNYKVSIRTSTDLK